MARGYGKNGKLYIQEGDVIAEIKSGKVELLNIIPGDPRSVSIKINSSFTVADFKALAQLVSCKGGTQ